VLEIEFVSEINRLVDSFGWVEEVWSVSGL
jgi:hypothetical protein